MKIEIGESLVYSWLRHVKQCQIVQTNWKPSPKWERHPIDLEQMKKDIENEFIDTNRDIFHKNNSISQLLQQAEIDVVGIAHGSECNERNYHFVDVAYHENGLNYGSNEETISRVLKKFIRSYFIYLQYFNDNSTAIFYFITPKMSKETIFKPLVKDIYRLEEVFKQQELSPDFTVLANEDFNELVLSPVLRISSEIADTNELFLRSAQLWKLFEDKPKTKKDKIGGVVPLIAKPILKLPNGKKKIGEHVRECLAELISKKLINSNMTTNLLSPDYSKDHFNLNFSFLRKIDQGRLDKNGSPRYYAKERKINETSFYFCSQWYERQWLQFDNWYREILEKK